MASPQVEYGAGKNAFYKYTQTRVMKPSLHCLSTLFMSQILHFIISLWCVFDRTT